MSIQIGAKPDAGFDNPIGMLTDCHRRVERFLSILCRVAERAQGRALNGEELTAVEAALHYFGESGPRHTRDEEDSLFPRLRARGEALAEIVRLEAEHREAELLHDQTAELYVHWIAAGKLQTADNAQLLAATRKLEAIYSEHIRIEEETVFPRAAQLLDRATLSEMGKEFKQRRSESNNPKS